MAIAGSIHSSRTVKSTAVFVDRFTDAGGHGAGASAAFSIALDGDAASCQLVLNGMLGQAFLDRLSDNLRVITAPPACMLFQSQIAPSPIQHAASFDVFFCLDNISIGPVQR